MEKIIEELQQWSYLQELPPLIGRFSLQRDMFTNGLQYRIFSYHNLQRLMSFSVLYDQATKDFMVRIVMGLTEYCDVDYIVVKLAGLEVLLRAKMKETIMRLSEFSSANLGSVFLAKGILEWEYGKLLPEEIAGFQLYIRPLEPLCMINGSYIVVDYSDFAAESNLIIYYNIYRDEFFGEIRVMRIPEATILFDAHTLAELKSKLQENLRKVLNDVRARLKNCDGLVQEEIDERKIKNN